MFSLSKSWLSHSSHHSWMGSPHISGFLFVSGDKRHLQQSEPGFQDQADKVVMSAVTTSKRSHWDCTSGPAWGPGSSFVQPTAQLTLFTAHKGSKTMRTFSILFLKGQVCHSAWTHTLLLCEETVITKITLILNLLVSGSRQAPLLLPTSITSAAKIPGQNLQAMFQEQGEFKVQ